MSDLISRSAAIDALGEEPMVWNDNDDYALGQRNQWEMSILAIETVPSEEPKQGHYIGEFDGYADVWCCWYCLECDYYFEECDERPTYKFCYNCGAKMEVVE